MNEWHVVWTTSARSYFRRAPKHFQQRVRAAIADIQANPFTHPNVRRLHGELEGLLRYRIGNFRLVYRVLEDNLWNTILGKNKSLWSQWQNRNIGHNLAV